MNWRQIFIVSFGLLFSTQCLAPANAATFELFDHGDGNLGPNYGLRVDDPQPDGVGGLGALLFSFELSGANAILQWDGNDTADGVVGATITGTLFEDNLDQSWELSYSITGIDNDGAGTDPLDGFTATGGFGTVTRSSDNLEITLTGEQNGAGFAFLFLPDGHRISGDNSTFVGRGWQLPKNSTDDFLFRAAVVPIPAALPLLGSALGILGIAGWRRRRRTCNA